jgi:hypothetical protein
MTRHARLDWLRRPPLRSGGKTCKQADRAAASTYRRDGRGGAGLRHRPKLRPRFPPYHGLEVADHGRVRMGPHWRARDVHAGGRMTHPMLDGCAHGVMQHGAVANDGSDVCAKGGHAPNHRLLGAAIGFGHVNRADKTQLRRQRRCRDALIARPRVGHDRLEVHPAGQEALAGS